MHTERKWVTATNGLILLAITFTLTLFPLKYERNSLYRTLTHKISVPRHTFFLYITTAVTYYKIVISKPLGYNTCGFIFLFGRPLWFEKLFGAPMWFCD